MTWRIVPREEKFFELFDLQASHGYEAARIFKELVAGWNLDSPHFERLRDIEHEADIATHEIIDKLNRTFVTPFDREDIHELAGETDSIIDLIHSLSSRMQVYRVEKTTPELIEMADILSQAADNVRKAVAYLRQYENAERRILDYCIEINRLENAGDRLLLAALGKLFQKTGDTLEIVKWKEIYEVAEMAIDKCEHVANIIEGIVVKQG